MRATWGQYQHSPFLSITCQVRFPAILTIARELPASFQEQVRKEYPLFQATRDRKGYRFDSQDAQHELLLLPDSLTVMSNHYSGWQDFQARIEAAVKALQSCYEPAFCARVGLRFQGLLRPVRCGLTQIQWAALINARVLGPFALPGHQGQLQGSRHEVVMALPNNQDRFRLTHGFVEVREPGLADQRGEPAYLLDQDYFTTQRIEWTALQATLDRFEQEAGQFFRQCVSEQLHAAMIPQAA